MAITTLLGYIIALVGIAVGAYLEHVTLKSVIGPSAFLIVVVGSIGATLVSHNQKEVKGFLKAFKYVFTNPRLDFRGTIDYLVELADKARKNGLLALQDDAEHAKDLLVKQGLQMAIDGADADKVRSTLRFISEEETEIFTQGSNVCNTAAGYMPTIGILGTVMAMTAVMNNLDKPETLGPSIAVAFLATLYGLGFANLIAAPWGSRLNSIKHEIEKYHQMVTDGILGILEGENPRNIRERLEVYMLHSQGKAAKAAE